MEKKEEEKKRLTLKKEKTSFFFSCCVVVEQNSFILHLFLVHSFHQVNEIYMLAMFKFKLLHISTQAIQFYSFTTENVK